MANKREVIDRIDESLDELDYVRSEVEELKVEEDGSIDKSYLIKYIEDIKSAINRIRDTFEEYDEEVSDIEDDLEGLVKRLSEVIK